MHSPTLMQRTRATACVFLLTLCASVAPQAQAHGKHYNLTGTWRTTITTYDCNTGVENPSFSGFLTFSSDGTTSEANANPAFQPGQRSAGHGYWERDGRNTFNMVVEAFILFNTAAPPPAPQLQRGKQRLDSVLKMTGRDRFESLSTSVRFFNTAGVQVSGGCARAAGERLW